ncbi:MAG: hypothetical protein JOY54_15065 [Acidobacteriaceae bacterium]|nr:hypothetical protein [Acidobacteriaceae bacterium]
MNHLLALFAATCAFAQREIPINRGSAALWQSLKKLHTRASLIMVRAHPDDEDGAQSG